MADFWSKTFGNNPLAAPKINIAAPVAPPPIAAPAPFDATAQTVTAPTSFTGAQITAPSPVSQTTLAPLGMLNAAQIAVSTGAGSMTDYQNQVAAQLAARASGQGPSIADMQAAQARQQNQAAIMSQLASARGGANPLAARTAMMANVAGNAQIDRDSMMAKIQEQQQAQQLLGQVAGQGRASDIQLGTSQAGLNQQAAIQQFTTQADYNKTQGQMNQDTALANYKGQLDTAIAQGSLDQRTAEMLFSQAQENARANAQLGQAFTDSKLKYIQMGLDVNKANQLAAIDIQKLAQSAQLGKAQIAQSASNANKQMFGGLMSGGAGILASGLSGSKKPDTTDTSGADTGLRTNPETQSKGNSAGPPTDNMVEQNAASGPVQAADVQGQSQTSASPDSSVNYTAKEPPPPKNLQAVNSDGGNEFDGGRIEAKNPEQRAVKRGDSPANDKIPTMLSEGEIVIPRSIMQSDDPVKGAADFITKILSKGKKK